MTEYKICTHCILDTKDDPEMSFTKDGVCNHCTTYLTTASGMHLNEPELKEKELTRLVSEIKSAGIGRDYDCVIGVSGGVDSTYLAYLCKQSGLRPLVVHFDNGWNSEMAVKNIENIVRKLDFDLYTYVNDWEEFRDLQLSFLQASVIDIELITDQAIVAVLFMMAHKHGIRYVLNGNNFATEAILPESWYHWKLDVLNITDIHDRFGKLPLKTYPMVGFWKRWYYGKTGHIKIVSLLNYVPYDKAQAKALITQELGWMDYGGKHYESIFTRFYQAYYLPVKFGVDKRKAHLSSLICSGQLSRSEALEEMKKELYPPDKLREDKEFVLKKLGLSDPEFQDILNMPARKHTEYASYLTRHYLYQAKFSRIFHSLKNLFRK
jgi:N-acetyl sugar amidotransferase